MLSFSKNKQTKLTNIEIIFIHLWEGPGLWRQWVAALGPCGECGEREELVLLQLQGESAAAVEKLEKENAEVKARCFGSSHLGKINFLKSQLKGKPDSLLLKLHNHSGRLHPKSRPWDIFL